MEFKIKLLINSNLIAAFWDSSLDQNPIGIKIYNGFDSSFRIVVFELVKRLTKGDRVGASAKNEVQGIGKLIDQFFKVAGFKAAREWATILFVLVRSEIDVIANEIGKLRVIIDGPVLDAGSGERCTSQISSACFDIG